MSGPYADTRWLPCRHRTAIERVPRIVSYALYAIVRPRDAHQAEESHGWIRTLRFVRHRYSVYEQSEWHQRQAIYNEIMSWNYGLTPWTNPSIHDVADVVEVLLHHYSNDILRHTMGVTLDDWSEEPVGRRRGSESSSGQ